MRWVCVCLLLLLAAANEYDEVSDGRFFSIVTAEGERRLLPPAERVYEAAEEDDETTALIDEEEASTTTTTPRQTPTPPQTTRRAVVTVATGVVASVYSPPRVLGTPPPNATVVYDVHTEGGGFSVRVPAGAWLWDDDRRSTPPQLSVTILELPTPFFLPDSGLLAVSPLAIALGPSGRRPHVPLEVRLPSAAGDYYQLAPNGTAARRCGDAGGWAAVSPLGVVLAGAPLLLPFVSAAPPPPSTTPPPPPATTMMEQAQTKGPSLVGALVGGGGGVVCLWVGLRVWRARQLRRVEVGKSSSQTSADLVHVM